MATAASPLTFVNLVLPRIAIAHKTVTGIVKSILFVNPRTVAIAMAPNATCDKPSPIKENLLSTSVTPRIEAQSAMSTPTISAYLTNGY
jgi:hypothetical protein